jgi:hypothetical protein
MSPAAIQTGDVVADPGLGKSRLGEVCAKEHGRLTVTPWPSRRTRERAAVTVVARDVLAHYQRPARVTASGEHGGVVLEPLMPHINQFRARSHDLQSRRTSTRPAVGECDQPAPGDSEEVTR